MNNMITCCEIALVLGITNVISLAIFAGYTINMKDKQIKLEKELKEVERVNGKEKRDIKDLQTRIEDLEAKERRTRF